VFCVDEVVIYNDGSQPKNKALQSSSMLVHILSYLECPQYLRKTLFPIHDNLRSAGLLPPLDLPSHLRSGEKSVFREAVSVSCRDGYSILDAGLDQMVLVKLVVPPKSRVTVRVPLGRTGESCICGEVVSEHAPRLEEGYYWGYSVREAGSLSKVLTQCPYEGGYDVSFGTSERGKPLSKVVGQGIPEFKNMLVVFGGLAGIEQAFRADDELRGLTTEPAELFDFWVNVCPGQGSRTIRTEEALWITLAGLRETVLTEGIR
jgi:predicted SPOUT superfamily RNA methylase MTH1